MLNDKLFKKFCKERHIKESTIDGYLSALKKYTIYHKLTLKELLKEAEIEEQKQIPLKERKIKKRIIEFRTYLFEKNKSSNTIKSYLTKIKTFYTHHEITLPEIPQAKYEQEYQISYYDLPTREHIQKAISISNIELKAIILFMVSSGTSKMETLSLTIQQFLEGTKEYHKKNITNENIPSILKTLENKKNIIPTLYLKRVKTDKYYYTFCSPEATNEIIKYLQTRDNLKLTDKLFNIKHSTLLSHFQKINDYNDWGFKGKYRFFRAHMLRKYHASNIGISSEYIDLLQGRGQKSIHETYIKTNPSELKKIYQQNMHKLQINDKPIREEKQEFTIVVNVFLSGKELNII